MMTNMKKMTIEIRKENYLWLKTRARNVQKTPTEIIENLVNQKIEENMNQIILCS